jgi:hypothetical protein
MLMSPKQPMEQVDERIDKLRDTINEDDRHSWRWRRRPRGLEAAANLPVIPGAHRT